MEKNKKIIIFFELFFSLLFIFMLSSGLVVSPFIGDINFIDEGQFGAWVTHMLHGKLMFRDIYITYGPILIYPLFLLVKIFGSSVFLIRIYFAILSFLGVISVLLIFYKLKISQFIRWMALGFLLIVPQIQLRQELGLLVLFLLFESDKKQGYRLKILFGMLLSFAFLFSPDIGIFCFLLVFIYYFFKMILSQTIISELKSVSTIFLGILLLAVPFVMWSVHEKWFGSYVNVTQDVLVSFSGIDVPNGTALPHVLDSLSIHNFVMALVSKNLFIYWLLLFYCITWIYLGMRFCLRKMNQHDLIIAFVALYGTFLYSILIGRSGHIFSLLGPAVIICSWYAQNLGKLLKKKSHDALNKSLSVGITIIIVLFAVRILYVFHPTLVTIPKLAEKLSENRATIKYLGPIVISKNQTELIKDFQMYMFNHVREGDSIFIFSNDPMLYLFGNKTNPTRFDLPFVANSQEKRMEILNDLIDKRPKYIIENTKSWPVDGVGNRQRLPEVYNFIQKNYKKIDTINSGVVYIK